MIYNNVNI